MREAYNDMVRPIAVFLVIGVHWVGLLSSSCPDIGFSKIFFI